MAGRSTRRPGRDHSAQILSSARKLALRRRIESLEEGRSDHVLALLAQAILQAHHHAGQADAAPLAVVQVAHASLPLRQKVERFHRNHAATPLLPWWPRTAALGLQARGWKNSMISCCPATTKESRCGRARPRTFSPTSTSGYSRCCWHLSCQCIC